MRTTDDTPSSLLDHPQRLGILPTRWFWDQENSPALRWASGLFAGLVVLVTLLLTNNIFVAGLVPPLILLLALGLFEKYIRHQALKRRASAETQAPDALPEQRQY
jgi:hypothetical protein